MNKSTNTRETSSILKLDIVGQIQAVKNKEIKASELLELTCRRIERLDPKVHAVVTTCFEQAREQLKNIPRSSVAAGVPMLIKDLKDVGGVRTTYGMGAFKDYVPAESDVYVKRLEDAGMVVIGKTSTPELGLLPVTEPLAYVSPKNPWDLSKTPGGSSGGAAAAVASGMMPCAQATDGGGSIRGPAHYCGLFGLKPSCNRVVSHYKHPFSIAVAGALSRSVRDSALMLALTETPDSERNFPAIGNVQNAIDRPLKIGLAMDDYFVGKNICDKDVADAIFKTAKLCESLGHQVEIAKPPVFGQELIDAFLMIWSSTLPGTLNTVEALLGRPITDADIEPWTQGFVELYHKNGGDEALEKVIKILKKAEKKTVQFLSGYDVVLSPVMPSVAHGFGKYDTSDKAVVEVGFNMAVQAVGYTAVYNVSGSPSMSVPLFRNANGLPIGSQFTALPGQDDLLLQLAYQLEAALPWAETYPVL